MEQGVLLKNKSKNGRKETIYYLNSDDFAEHEKQPQRRLLGWGCVNKNITVLIIT